MATETPTVRAGSGLFIDTGLPEVIGPVVHVSFGAQTGQSGTAASEKREFVWNYVSPCLPRIRHSHSPGTAHFDLF